MDCRARIQCWFALVHGARVVFLMAASLIALASAGPIRAQDSITPTDMWVWQNPLPQGNVLRGVWAADVHSVWAVGDGGIILKWDGSQWAAERSGTNHDLNRVWGTDADNVWAVGDSGTVLKLFTLRNRLYLPLVAHAANGWH